MMYRCSICGSKDCCGGELEVQVDELKSKVERLSSRGIEDMQHRIAELENQLAHKDKVITGLQQVLVEADEYLNTNHMTNIGHGSILHRKFQEYAKEAKK